MSILNKGNAMNEIDTLLAQVESRPTKKWWFKKDHYPLIEDWHEIYRLAVERGYDVTLCDMYCQIRKRGA